jgi:hypothetical protein
MKRVAGWALMLAASFGMLYGAVSLLRDNDGSLVGIVLVIAFLIPFLIGFNLAFPHRSD